MKTTATLVLALIILVFASCQPSTKKKTVFENSLDTISKEMKEANIDSYTVILEDMDIDKGDNYIHKYKILKVSSIKQDTITKDTILTSTTTWMPVSKEFFMVNEKNLGMELMSKQNDSISKFVSPPGYSHYINNEKYGEWREDSRSGVRTWQFFAGYLFLNSILRTSMYPVRHSNYSTFSSNRRAGKTYYGNNMYGSGGSYTKASGSGTSWNKSSKNSTNMKNSRNGTRYNSKTSKSRSGGFGK